MIPGLRRQEPDCGYFDLLRKTKWSMAFEVVVSLVLYVTLIQLWQLCMMDLNM